MKVTNRSTGLVVYAIPEMHVRRVFSIGETKDIEENELNQLFQLPGGAELLKDSLLVHDKEWVKKTWDAPIEYFWGVPEVKKCILEDSIELFKETLEYAPAGVIDLIKEIAWKLPCNDLNKT